MPLLQSFLERQRERDAIFDYESGGVFVIFRRQYAEGDIAFYTGVHGEDRLCCVLNLTSAQQHAGGTSSGPGFILGPARRSRRRGGTSPDPLRISSQGTM